MAKQNALAFTTEPDKWIKLPLRNVYNWALVIKNNPVSYTLSIGIGREAEHMKHITGANYAFASGYANASPQKYDVDVYVKTTAAVEGAIFAVYD